VHSFSKCSFLSTDRAVSIRMRICDFINAHKNSMACSGLNFVEIVLLNSTKCGSFTANFTRSVKEWWKVWTANILCPWAKVRLSLRQISRNFQYISNTLDNFCADWFFQIRWKYGWSFDYALNLLHRIPFKYFEEYWNHSQKCYFRPAVKSVTKLTLFRQSFGRDLIPNLMKFRHPV